MAWIGIVIDVAVAVTAGWRERAAAELHRDAAVRSVACLDVCGEVAHARVGAEGADGVVEQVAEVEPARLAGSQVGERQVVGQVLVLAERVARLAEPVGEALDRVRDRLGVLALRCRLSGADDADERERHPDQDGDAGDVPSPPSLN